MNRATKTDLSNLQQLRALVAEHSTAETALAALEAQLVHMPARLGGLRQRDLRMSMNTDAGAKARQEDSRLEALYTLMYAQMGPPTAR